MSTENTNQNGAGGDTAKLDPSQMSSKDYYFDSYAHFGIHEVSYYS